ncbi:MAG: adenylate/guanylate cyclase domain-containing protein [Desulfomonilia bacterium]
MNENIHNESDRRLVTVMFADISGFTAMSEKMDPEEVTEVMKDCFSMMGKCIEEHGGAIDKFMGDCVMVLFGAPMAQEDAPHRALNTALEIRTRLQKFNEDKRLSIPLNIHIGINTGPVIAGMMGSDKRQDFTVMGDTVNLASRMESTAETGDILVAEDTYRLTEGYFDFEPIGGVKVKGKEQPVKAYKVLGPRRIITRIETCGIKGLSPFVGRSKELEHLRGRLEQVYEGHGQVVGIIGEPGVGKSRLICQFRDSLQASEYTIIEGGCIHYGDAIPYLPILDMLKDHFDIKEDEHESSMKKKISEKVAQLNIQPSQVLPALFEILSLTGEDEEYLKLDGKQRRDKVFEAIRLILIAESQIKPLIVTVEDLHWMDKTSEEFLSYLINGLGATRIMLILLYRPEYTHSWANKTYYSQVRVDQLSKKTSEDLVQGILCGEVDASLGDFIIARTEGNPLFIEELTQNLVENGSITKEEGRYLLSLKPTDIQVPATIQGIIAARLDRLEGNLKKIMQMASVIGREFAFRILQSIATLKEDLKSSLLNLQDLEFIYEKNLFPELEYIFKHALTRDVAYNSLLIKKRKETHENVGQAIETIYKDRLEEFYEILAYHYALSENTQKACHYLKLSGDKAAKSYANWEAIRFYQEALKVLDAQSGSQETRSERLGVCLSIMGPMWLIGYPEGTLEILHDAEMLAHELGDDERSLATVYSRLGHYHTFKGNIPLATEYSEKCFDTAEKIGSIELMAQVVRGICTTHFFTGNCLKVVELGRRTLPSLEEHHREKDLYVSGSNVYSGISGYCGMSLGMLGEFVIGKIILEKGLQNAWKINNRPDIGWVEFCHCAFSCWEGDGDSAVDHGQKATKCLEEAGVEYLLGFAWSVLSLGYYFRGEHELARESADKGLKIQEKIGMPYFTAWCSWVLAFVLYAARDLMRANECAEKSLKLARELKMKHCEGVTLILLGCLKGKMDPTCIDEAHNQIRKGIMVVEELKQRPLSAIGYLRSGELFADAGRKEEALENLKKAEGLYLEMKVTPKSHWLKRTQEALAKLEAIS